MFSLRKFGRTLRRPIRTHAVSGVSGSDDGGDAWAGLVAEWAHLGADRPGDQI